ncbi:hypothetical protein [Rhodopirellula bahusiensis]|uniref:Uncharacterized protein n=1 Tax=Rhodopirellula bahusiensis TaxID=2014065 RepID=A0A2G1W451_9BACT|nr:hypothetical protein [Rhodopirellula bahusiensis]PHQ33814.1 hypothetical protein CEE69_17945 [Rhodopirellula bahusiensis]
MNHPFGTPTRMILAAVVILLFVVSATFAFLSLSTVEHLATGSAEKTILVECEFDKFRQIMVRKNATAAIVGQSGMRLIDESVEDLQLDTSQDDRPILNAIRGQSKAQVQAVKKLRVSLNDPHITADELTLRQRADIQPDAMSVVTQSIAAADNLESYKTTLDARPKGNQTEVTLLIALDVRVTVPKAFTGRADREVQQSAVDGVDEQADGLQRFVAEHAGQRFILPEFGSGSD